MASNSSLVSTLREKESDIPERRTTGPAIISRKNRFC
jgi:hypothetical protein